MSKYYLIIFKIQFTFVKYVKQTNGYTISTYKIS
jgi:hypothetical protein